MLEILFHPTAVESFQEKMVMVCDNCHVKYFSISGTFGFDLQCRFHFFFLREGQMAQVELASVEEGVDEPLAGEPMDVTAAHLIRFNTLNPYTYVQKKVSVRNVTGVALPYNWLLIKPFIRSGDFDPNEIPSERVQDMESVFSIEPEGGVLAPDSVTSFNITYAPPEVNIALKTIVNLLFDLIHR